MANSISLYQNGKYWVTRVRNGYEIYEDGFTHSTRVVLIPCDHGDEGLARAKARTDAMAGKERKQVTDTEEF